MARARRADMRARSNAPTGWAAFRALRMSPIAGTAIGSTVVTPKPELRGCGSSGVLLRSHAGTMVLDAVPRDDRAFCRTDGCRSTWNRSRLSNFALACHARGDVETAVEIDRSLFHVERKLPPTSPRRPRLLAPGLGLAAASLTLRYGHIRELVSRRKRTDSSAVPRQMNRSISQAVSSSKVNSSRNTASSPIRS